jgi:hypothetical protein
MPHVTPDPVKPRTPSVYDWQKAAEDDLARVRARRQRARRMLTSATLLTGALWALIVLAVLELLRVVG